jgi:hypothetical protein
MILLSGVESASRYPLKSMQYQNLKRLAQSDMKPACKHLIEMLSALLATYDYMKNPD